MIIRQDKTGWAKGRDTEGGLIQGTGDCIDVVKNSGAEDIVKSDVIGGL